MDRDHFKLYFIILIWSFTAVLGVLLTMGPVAIVANRTAIAALCLACLLGSKLRVPIKDALLFVTTGVIIGVHWITFFMAAKVANISICMAGMATISLWTALLEPIFIRQRKLRPIDLMFGVVVAIGVLVIYLSGLDFHYGLGIALVSAVCAASFSIFNGFHIKKSTPLVITFYEMLGSTAFAMVVFPFTEEVVFFPPTAKDWLWMLILAILCTVYAFSAYVELLKRLTVYTINFANNLEPVFGTLLAAFFFQDYDDLDPNFYLGGAIILLSVCAYPFIRRRYRIIL